MAGTDGSSEFVVPFISQVSGESSDVLPVFYFLTKACRCVSLCSITRNVLSGGGTLVEVKLALARLIKRAKEHPEMADMLAKEICAAIGY